MTPKHTPEPWRVFPLWDESGLTNNKIEQDCQPGGTWKSDTPTICTFPPAIQNRANAERIVACVNALAGLNPEAVRDVVDALQMIFDDVHHGRATVKDNVTLVRIHSALRNIQGKGKRIAFEKAEWNQRGRDGLGPENPLADPKCQTCKGHGIVDGGGLTGAAFLNCPDCHNS